MGVSVVTQTAGPVARDEVRQMVNRLVLLAANSCLSSGAVAIGTTTTKIQSVATTTYKIDGVLKSKAATDDLWVLSGTVVAASMFQKYMLLLDASGAASIIEGVQASTAAGVVLPTPPQSKCIAATITVATDSSHTFTPGTTALGATGITTTYSNGFDSSLLSIVALS